MRSSLNMRASLGALTALGRAPIQGGGVVPPVPGTPNGPDEAVIVPAVMTQRSSFSQTKGGVVQARPAQMATGAGCYYADIVRAPSAAYPDRHFLYYSSDHATDAGGIYLSVAVTDPTVPANWKTYEDAVAAGWLNDIPSKPAANPIYIGAGTRLDNQCETPWVNVVNGVFVLTYQLEGGVPGARNQATLRATSPDGINFAGPNAPLMQVSAADAIGDGHHGYAKWGPNPFPRDKVPYNYVMYSLIGGQSRGLCAMWGWDDPVNGTPVFISALTGNNGRFVPTEQIRITSNWLQGGFNAIDVKSMRRTRQGVSALIGCDIPTSGASAREGQIYEIVLADDGYTVLKRPILVIARGPETYDAGQVATPATFIFGDKRAVLYVGATTANEKTVDISTGPLRNPQNSWARTPSPATPPYTETVYDLRGLSALPAGLEAVLSGGAALSFDANGMTVTVNQATGGEAMIFGSDGFSATDAEYAEIIVDDLVTTSAQANRYPYVGFSANKVARASMMDAMFLGNNEATSELMWFKALVAGAQPVTSFSSSYYYGVGYGTAMLGQASSKKHVGMRWFPRSKIAYAVGEGRSEMQELRSMSAAMDYTKTYYPFFGVKAAGSGITTERISKITLRKYSKTRVAGEVVLGTSMSIGSAANVAVGGTYTLAVGFDAEAANRTVAFFVSGRSYDAVPTSISAVLTPASGAAIPLTAKAFTFDGFSGAGAAWQALFVVALPAGGTTGSMAVTINGAASQRCAVGAVTMYGASVDPVSRGSSSGAGNAPYLTPEISKAEGGVTVCGVLHSTSGGTFFSLGKEESRFATDTQEIIVSVNANATVNFQGLVGADAAIGVETSSGNSGGAVALVASWAKAA